MTLGVFVGTRPDIIKLSPVISQIEKIGLPYVLIHTGQHYNEEMSSNFFKELNIPSPHHFLETNEVSASDIGQLMSKTTRLMKSIQLDASVVLGDTNSALSAALASSACFVPVAHVEAGCRSFDRRMPEEINRVLISDCASLHFAPTRNCVANLARESVAGDVVLTGHPIVDLLNEVLPRVSSHAKGTHEKFVLMTLHRPENVDDSRKLRLILDAFGDLNIPILFPIHPRTRKNLENFGIDSKISPNIRIVEPLGYFETLSAIKDALFVATDSGGIQQEAFVLKTPCVTIRRSYEWRETFDAGVNFLANPETPDFKVNVDTVRNSAEAIRLRFAESEPVFGDGHASEQIANLLKRYA